MLKNEQIDGESRRKLEVRPLV